MRPCAGPHQWLVTYSRPWLVRYRLVALCHVCGARRAHPARWWLRSTMTAAGQHWQAALHADRRGPAARA